MKRHLPIACGLDVHKDIIEACILVSKGYAEPQIIRQSFTTLRGGLLTYSFVPERNVRDLREFARFYRKQGQERVRILNRLEKFLQSHGFKLSSVLSNIDGVSGRKILEILCEKGEVGIGDVRVCLARGVKKTTEEIVFAINGRLSEVHRMLLREILDTLYSHEAQNIKLQEKLEIVGTPFDSHINLLSTIPGIDRLSATYIIAEIGVDMTPFAVTGENKKAEARICSWAGLSPKNDMSAGKIKSKKVSKGNSYVKTILVQCAWAVTKTRNTRLSNWYWHNVGRLGQKTAIIAVARKLLGFIYHMLSSGTVYDDSLDRENAEKINAKKLESVQKRLQKLAEKLKDSKNCNAKENTKKQENGTKSPPREKSPTLASADNVAVPKKRGRPKKGESVNNSIPAKSPKGAA
jgi:hypothetical protein